MKKSKRQLEKQLKSIVSQTQELECRKLDTLIAIFKLKGCCYLCEKQLHAVDECQTFAGTCVGCGREYQTINPDTQCCLACDFNQAVTHES